jgi:hypothetical protein
MSNSQDRQDNKTQSDYIKTCNEDTLLNFYNEFNSNRKSYDQMKWDTIRLYTSLNTLFITATVAILTYKYDNVNISTNTKFVLSLSFLPISVIIISFIGIGSAYRESILLFEQEASMFKIEKYLGLHDQIPDEKCWLKGDPYFVPQKNRNIYHRTQNLIQIDPNLITLNDWIKARMLRHNFLLATFGVYLVEIGVSIALLAMIWTSSD